MKNENKVQLTGYAGTDIQVYEFREGSKVARFTLGTHEYFKNKLGEWVDTTSWHRIVLWNDQAEVAVKAVKRGLPISITGRLTYRFFETPDGEKRLMAEVIASAIKQVA
jgi:single-strand DNA-binding protein